MDAATVRPRVVPPAAGVRGVRAESPGTLALAVERRNTLHFNPAHVPRLDPGETFWRRKTPRRGRGPGRGPGPGRGRGLRGYTVDADSSESGSGSGSGFVPPWRAHLTDAWDAEEDSSVPGGAARFIHPDEAAAARAAAAARGDRDPYETPRKIPDSNRFDTAFRHPRDRGRVRPGVVAGFVEDKDDDSGPDAGDGRRGGAGGGGGELWRGETRATKSNDDAVWSRECWVDRDDARGGGATRSSRRARAFLGFTVREESTS